MTRAHNPYPTYISFNSSQNAITIKTATATTFRLLWTRPRSCCRDVSSQVCARCTANLLCIHKTSQQQKQKKLRSTCARIHKFSTHTYLFIMANDSRGEAEEAEEAMGVARNNNEIVHTLKKCNSGQSSKCCRCLSCRRRCCRRHYQRHTLQYRADVRRLNYTLIQSAQIRTSQTTAL